MKNCTSTTDLHVRQMYVCVMDRQGKKLVHTNLLAYALYVKAIHGGKNKNDRIDSEKLAHLLRSNLKVADEEERATSARLQHLSDPAPPHSVDLIVPTFVLLFTCWRQSETSG